MIEFAFGSQVNMLLILLSIVFHMVRSLHDGISDLGHFMLELPRNFTQYKTVGKWPWHIINWLGRDIVLFGLYIWLYINGTPLITLVTALVVVWFTHDFIYWWAASHRRFFESDLPWFPFPSIFKRIFGRK